DQIRGWFYSLLGSGVVRYQKSPYRSLMMHGFFLDEKGEKMSKSVGNFIAIEDIKAKYGADAFRLFVLSNTVWDDLKFSWEGVKEAYSDLDILVNMSKYIRIVNASNSKPKELEPEDRWMVSRVNSTLSQYHTAFNNRMPNDAVKAVRKLLVEDFSQFYMKIAKDRISKGENKEAALYTIYYTTFSITKMLAPIAPFVTEYIYQDLFRGIEGAESIHMSFIDNDDNSKVDVSLEEAMGITSTVISSAMKMRNDAKINVRWPLAKIVIRGSDEKVSNAVKYLSPIVKRMMNVKDVEVSGTIGDDYLKQETPFGIVAIPSKIDEELKAEGMSNEIMRRVQQMRKEAKLVEKNVGA
ncbi:MAG: class I tRNA ligase family protein, partial [Candidatus Micrarchaeota archaeon]|nr:class I tRNA ligase family protein [Candidatus Micrarchaeota archaeon]